MKLIIVLLSIPVLSAFSYAQSQYEKELSQLTEQRDKAVAAATDPINRKYREALEQMLKKAMQASDLEGAIKIKAALEIAPDDVNPFVSIESAIEGTRWLWPIEFAGNTPEEIRWISFGPDKVIKHGWYGSPATWRQAKPNVIELTQDGKTSFVWKMEFDSKFKKAKVSRIDGRENHSMRVIESDAAKSK